MTLTLRRVERAEKRFIELGGCTLCAATPKTYEVVWVVDENDSAEEYCPQCGRKTSLTVGWRD